MFRSQYGQADDDYKLSRMIKDFKKRNYEFRRQHQKHDIDHKNQILMNKLMSISMEKRGYSTHKPRRRIPSLNQFNRKVENIRISRENEKFAERLFFKKPNINVKKLDKDFKHCHLYHKKRLRKLKFGNKRHSLEHQRNTINVAGKF